MNKTFKALMCFVLLHQLMCEEAIGMKRIGWGNNDKKDGITQRKPSKDSKELPAEQAKGNSFLSNLFKDPSFFSSWGFFLKSPVWGVGAHRMRAPTNMTIGHKVSMTIGHKVSVEPETLSTIEKSLALMSWTRLQEAKIHRDEEIEKAEIYSKTILGVTVILTVGCLYSSYHDGTWKVPIEIVTTGAVFYSVYHYRQWIVDTIKGFVPNQNRIVS